MCFRYMRSCGWSSSTRPGSVFKHNYCWRSRPEWQKDRRVTWCIKGTSRFARLLVVWHWPEISIFSANTCCTPLKSPRRHARAVLHWSLWPLEPKLEPWQRWEKFSRTSNSKTPLSIIQSHPTILAWGWDTSEKALYQCPAFGPEKHHGTTTSARQCLTLWCVDKAQKWDEFDEFDKSPECSLLHPAGNRLWNKRLLDLGQHVEALTGCESMELDKMMWKHRRVSSWPPIWFMPTSKDTRVPWLSGGQWCMRKPISPSLPIYAPNSKRASQKGWVKSSLRSMDKTQVGGIGQQNLQTKKMYACVVYHDLPKLEVVWPIYHHNFILGMNLSESQKTDQSQSPWRSWHQVPIWSNPPQHKFIQSILAMIPIGIIILPVIRGVSVW